MEIRYHQYYNYQTPCFRREPPGDGALCFLGGRGSDRDGGGVLAEEDIEYEAGAEDEGDGEAGATQHLQTHRGH